MRNRAIIKRLTNIACIPLEGAVQHAPSSFLGLISKALRDNHEDVAKEPLPQRWVDLINYLNGRERVEAERHAPEEPTKRRPIH